LSVKLNRFLGILAAVIGIVAIIPIDAVAWWKVDVYPKSGSSYSNFVDVGGMYNGLTELGGVFKTIQLEIFFMYFLAGLVVFLGVILLLAGGIKAMKVLVVIGGFLAISGPIIFLIAHGQNTSFLTEANYLGSYNIFFGTASIPKWNGVDGTSNWYLGVGFYLSFAAGGLGILNWRLKWPKAAPWAALPSEPDDSPQEDEETQRILAEINKGKLPPEGEGQPDKESVK